MNTLLCVVTGKEILERQSARTFHHLTLVFGGLNEQEADTRLHRGARSIVGQETHRTVFRRGSDEILGIVMLTPLEEDMEISYLFFPEYWGLGYAKEASSRLIRFGFETLGCKQIFAITQSQNLRSVKLLESLGMRLCETFIEFSAEQSKYRLGNPFLSVD